MYVRRESHKPPLTRLTMVPSGFSAASTSTTLDINGKTKEITVDRLKPAKLIEDPGTVALLAAVSAQHSPTLPALRENTSTPNQVPSYLPTMTRAGRLSRRPAHLSDYL